MMYYNVGWKASTAASKLVKEHVATCFGCVRECFHSLSPARANRQGPSYNMLHLTLSPHPADLFLPESPEQRVRRRESPDFSAVQQLHATGEEEKQATFNHLMTKLPFRMWTHHACAQHARIGDTVTSNNAESSISQIGEEVRLMQDLQRWSERQGRNVVPLRFGGNQVQGRGLRRLRCKRILLALPAGCPWVFLETCV